ncbi:MAG TPA: hypothetical protein VHV08_04000, partial [Pirellulales bacterium]|nr:hypothetical protein [Pirellulales bacterium]
SFISSFAAFFPKRKQRNKSRGSKQFARLAGAGERDSDSSKSDQRMEFWIRMGWIVLSRSREIVRGLFF